MVFTRVSHDDSDRENGRTVSCPLLALWGKNGAMEALYDAREVWSHYADDSRGEPVDSGHFLAEESPEETARKLTAFLSG